MAYTILTLPFDAAKGEFDESKLRRLLDGADVKRMQESFFCADSGFLALTGSE